MTSNRRKRRWKEIAAALVILGAGFAFGLLGSVAALVIVYLVYRLQLRWNSKTVPNLTTASLNQTPSSVIEGFGQGASPLTNTYFDEVERRLTADSFKVSRNVTLPGCTVELVATKSGFKASVLGVRFSFVFLASSRRLVGPLTGDMIFQFSDDCFDYALENRGAFAPRLGGGTVESFAVIVSDDSPSDELKRRVEEQPGPRHWGATEFPVVVSLGERQLYFCKKTPYWGGAYYRGQKKFVKRQLAIPL